MEKIKLVLPIMALCVLVACTPIASKKCQSALDAGKVIPVVGGIAGKLIGKGLKTISKKIND